MKALIALLAFVASTAFGTTLNPVQLLNPAGSTSGQAIVSTGASSAPAWANVAATALAAQAANTVVGNATSSSASPTAITVTGCNGAAQALQWTNGSGFGCNSAIATSGANSNITSLNAPALGAATATTAAATTNTTQVATTAMVNSAITGGSLAGTFTKLVASGNDALNYYTVSGQTIASSTNVTLTGYTKVYDRVNLNFNASTGTFTAPSECSVTCYYQVSGQVVYAAAAGVVNAQYSASVVVNGSPVCNGQVFQQSTGTEAITVPFSCTVAVTNGQTILIQAFQNTGASRTLGTIANTNMLSIARLP
jgi:hypothetical protein